MLSTLFGNDVRQTLDQFRRSVDQMFENFYAYETQPAAGDASGGELGHSAPWWSPAGMKISLTFGPFCPAYLRRMCASAVQNNQIVIEGERKAPEGFQKNAWTQLAYGNSTLR